MAHARHAPAAQGAWGADARSRAAVDQQRELVIPLPRHLNNAARPVGAHGGRHFCVSFAAQQDSERMPAHRAECDAGQRRVSPAKRAAPRFDLHRFYDWIELILAHPHWAVVPDVIDGTDRQQRENGIDVAISP